jgi:hypothetical protein
MSDQRDNLSKEMNEIKVDKATLRALSELTYTASETGLIPFAFHDEADMAAMVRLVELSRLYATSGVPSKLRM